MSKKLERKVKEISETYSDKEIIEKSLARLNDCKSGKRKRIENPEDHVFEPPKKLYALDVDNLPVPMDPILVHDDDSETTVENNSDDEKEVDKFLEENDIELEETESYKSDEEEENTEDFNEAVFNSLMKELEGTDEELLDLNRSNEKHDYLTMEKLEHNIGDLLGEQESNEGIQTVMKLSELWINEIKPKLLKKVSSRCNTPEGDQNMSGECEICEKENPKVTTLDWSTLDLDDLKDEYAHLLGTSEENPIIL